MRKYRIPALLLTMAMLLTISAAANSAQRHWTGTSATGVISSEEVCPVVVEQENLTFDIQSFPTNRFHAGDEAQGSAGSVTAEYTFYNPSADTVTATLLFPFGGIPAYAEPIDFARDREKTDDDLHNYGVSADGIGVDAALRHSYFGYDEQFELETCLPRLIDGWAEDDFYDPEMSITKYTYQVQAGDKKLEDNTRVQVICSLDAERTRVYLDCVNEAESTPDGLVLETNYRSGHYREEGRLFFLYVVGEPLKEEPLWSLSTRDKDSQQIELPIQLVNTEEIPLKELFLLNRNPEGEVSQSDWYNAVLYLVNRDYTGEGFIGRNNGLDVRDSLMRWYEYELTFAPGQRLVNSVTAPVYPSINEAASPNKYEYTYLLSPAKTWASFGNLNITVNTPFYLLESNQEGFEQTLGGYHLSLDGLPEGELIFTLCASEHPTSNTPDVRDCYRELHGNLVLFVLMLGAAVVGVVLLVRRIVGK